jgi:hypothetical protein
MIWKRSTYSNSGTLAVFANDDDGSPYGIATVYLERQSETLPKDCAFVDTNNWPDIVETLEKADLAEELIDAYGASGFCVYPAMRFKIEKISEAR